MIKETEFSVISQYAKQAEDEGGAMLTEGKTPINWFGYYEDSNFIGCIGLLIIGSRARIRGWYVLPEFRGKAIGIELLNFAVFKAKERRLKGLEMNTKLIDFAVKQGWKKTGKVFKMKKWFNGHGERLIYDL